MEVLNPSCLHFQSPKVQEEGGGCDKGPHNMTQFIKTFVFKVSHGTASLSYLSFGATIDAEANMTTHSQH